MDILAVHLDFPYLYTSLIQKKGKKGEVRTLRSYSLLEAGIKDFPKKPFYLDFKGQIASGLSAKNFLIRSMEVKMTKGKHVQQAIAFQSQALTPFNPEEVLIVPLIDQQEAQLFTVPKEALKEHLLELQKLGLDPDTVSTNSSALFHFIQWKFPTLAEALVIDLGSNETTCISIEKNKLKKSHAIAKGIEHLFCALHEDRKKILLKKEIEGSAKQIDLLHLKTSLHPHLFKELNELRQELAKVQYSFTKLPKPIIFTGKADAFIHLREFLTDFSEGEWHLSSEEKKFAISIGLGLEQTFSSPLQLRIAEFFPKKNWRRMGSYAFALLACSFLLGSILLSFGVKWISLRKEAMFNAIAYVPKEGNQEKILQHWIDTIEANDQEYPYILQTPKACKVFAWLSSHPLLEEFRKQGDPMDLQEIKYQLVSYPSIDSEKEPYLSKVELEFNFKNLMNARRFHEALREGDDWVNSDLEITWEVLNQGYRTSFFMNSRGPDVS